MREKWSAAPRRIAAFDALRGFALVNMAVYHGVYDWVYVFGRPAAWFTQTGNAHIWQQFICWTFILLAGAVFPYGKHAVRRGAVTFGCGFLLTAVTMLVMPSEQILFGVLHLIGAAVLLSALLRRFLDRAPALPGAIASFVLFLFLRSVPMGYLGIGELQLFELPRQLYSVPFLFPLGLPGPGFYSADYSVLDGAFPVAFSAPVCRRDGARLACLPSIGLAGAAQLVGIFAASACFVGLYIFVIDIDRQLIRRKDVENGFGLVSEMFHLPACQGMAG